MIVHDSLGVPHGFFTREGGHSAGAYAALNCGYGSGDDRATVARNRAIVAEELNVPAPRLLTVRQSHSATAIVAKEPWDLLEPLEGDAVVTATPGLAVGVLTADCTPVLFADAQAGVVAAAHAGWKGALNGITDAAIETMETLGARRAEIRAVIGPAISKANYEVGPEFVARFAAASAGNARHFSPSPRPGHAMFDLPAYVAARLRRAGIGHVADLAICTYAGESRFFSFRRTTHRGEKHYGRQLSAIRLP